MRTCTKCNEAKDESQFAQRGKKLRGVCRDCQNALNRKRYKERMGGKTKREKYAEFRESDPKICVRCNVSKPLSDFNVHNKEKGLHRNFCKDCQNAWARKHNQTPQAKDVRGKWNKDNAEKIQEYKELYKKLDKLDPERVEKKKAYHRKRNLMKDFGLTPQDYDNMLKGQSGKCMICESDKPGNGRKSFAVDHCHTTGKVRGLLCFPCNVSIGHFNDDSELLRKAASYLESP